MPQAASPNWPALSPTGGRTLTQACLNLSRPQAATHGVQHRLSRSVSRCDLLSAPTQDGPAAYKEQLCFALMAA